MFNIDPQTYELFEFNKMFFVYGITILVVTLWLIRSLEEKRFIFKKTFLDYPIVLFLLSQILSTIFSIDTHTSIWGYYSRFHGGLLSSICYALLYWAMVSNLYGRKHVHILINTILLSGTFVAWYGIAQHYGIDKDFWVQNVQARVFSSLGQPNWLAAFLVALIPLSISYFLFESRLVYKVWYLVAAVSMFVSFLFTASRSGLIAFSVAIAAYSGMIVTHKFGNIRKIMASAIVVAICISVYTVVYYKFPQMAILASIILIGISGSAIVSVSNNRNRIWMGILTVIIVITGFIYSSPDSFRFGISGTAPGTPAAAVRQAIPQDAGGTETGSIRFIVWRGAWDIFTHYPILGSGVETFAYAFYQYRPVELLRTTEWDFLYNKAHNEYINILATTGLFGITAYLVFVFYVFREVWKIDWPILGKIIIDPEKKLDIKVDRVKKPIVKEIHSLAHLENTAYLYLVSTGLLSGIITILITNFFGFSVVNVSLFFFLFPSFLVLVTERERFSLRIMERAKTVIRIILPKGKSFDFIHIVTYGFVIFAGMFLLSTLLNFWFADIRFAEGRMYNKQGQIGLAHQQFSAALELRKDEPFYYSELGWTESEMVYALMKENNASSASELAHVAETNVQTAVNMSPNNTLYWKKLADAYYNLTFFDYDEYKDRLKISADRTHTLAPTDVSTLIVLSNYYEHLGDFERAIKILSQATEWKPDLAVAWNRFGEVQYAKYKQTKDSEDLDKANEYRYKASQLDTTNEGYKKGFE